MAASITQLPAAKAYAGNPILIEIETDLITLDYTYYELEFSSLGPSIPQTLTLTWSGGSITYTVGSAADDTGLIWPTKGLSESISDYTLRIGDILRQREDVNDLFYITRPSTSKLRFTRKVAELFPLTAIETMTNVTGTVHLAAAAPTEDNLRALVQVWSDTGDFSTDQLLDAQHAPYNLLTSKTKMDVSPAFFQLQTKLPDTDSINPYPTASSLEVDLCNTISQKYYLRYADKFGTPALAQALVKTASFEAFLGSRSLDAQTLSVPNVLHNYVRTDGASFFKPVSTIQPDWVYVTPQFDSNIYISVLITWSDGSESVFNPFGTSGVAAIAGTYYAIPAGFKQLNLDTVTPGAGTQSDAYIAAYTWRLAPLDDSLNYQASIQYKVLHDSAWHHYLLMETGLGGCESVWLRGKGLESFTISSEEYRQPRGFDTLAQVLQSGDFAIFEASGRTTWQWSTGWYDDPYYLNHLRQLPLGNAWIIDVDRRLLKKVTIDSRELQVNADDETLFSLEFTIRAGWQDESANI